MNASPTGPDPVTHTQTVRAEMLTVPGASLHYELRGNGGPLVVLHAAPMDARNFESLGDILSDDYAVLTADPRGIARSSVDDRFAPSTPDRRAEDLAYVIEHVDAGPAMVFGSSGGAVSALALAATRPDLLRGVVAHEPPVAALVDDRDRLCAATEDMIETYRDGDRRGHWEQFLRIAGIDIPDDVFEVIFGAELTGQEAEDERFGVEQMEMATTFWEPPLERLRAVDIPIVVGIGVDSTGQLCDRTSVALARALDIQATAFPGDHVGFTTEPEAFASTLRKTLLALQE